LIKGYPSFLLFPSGAESVLSRTSTEECLLLAQYTSLTDMYRAHWLTEPQMITHQYI